MRDATRQEIEAFWSDLFGLGEDELWAGATVLHPHLRLGDYEGWYVAWRASGVHVSAPSSAAGADFDELRRTGLAELQDPVFWRDFAQTRSLTVLGPSVHHYLDEDPGVPEDVEQVDPVRLTLLRDKVTVADWAESGIPDALADGGEALAFWGPGEAARPWVPALLGGAVLTETAGANRDVGLLVVEDARGRGVGRRLGQAATSYAVSWHGWARWTCRATNEPSLRTAAGIGFRPYATQLALKP